MSGEDQNRLDKLFKDGLDGPNNIPNFRESDWDNLEQLLDGGNRRGGVVRLWPYLSGVAALLLLAIGWWFFQPQKTGKAGNGNNVAVTKPATSQQQGSSSAINSPGVDTASTQKHGSSAPAPQQNNGSITATPQTPVYAGTTNNGTHTGNGANGNNTVGAGKHNAVSPVNKSALQAQDVNDSKTAVQQPVVQQTSGSQLIANNNTVQPPVNNVTGSQSTQTQVSGTHTSQQAAVTGNADNGQTITPAQGKQADVIANVPATNTKPVKQPVKLKPVGGEKRGPQFAITVLASPDINGVGSFKENRVGTNIGMQFSASFGKLTVSTGAAYSKKPYLTDFSNYHTSYQFKTNPVDVYADCRVLDIPLNVDYKLYNKNKNAFSVGTGLSSYIMLKEKYTYDYPAVSGYAGPADFTVTNRNKHILGVLNLNTTYQRELNSKFSVAVQPYLKIPLTNIGQSQVKLQSAGVSVGFSWKINPSKTP